MFVQNLISDFNNQLNISDHDLNVLSGFFHFLKNQTNTSRASVPYGLLLQYDNEKVKELFLEILDKALMAPQFSGKYRLVWINEEDFSGKSLGQCVNRSGDIFLLRTCLSHGNPDHLISEFEKHPEIIKIVCASSEIVETRFKKDEHFFYRILPRHILLGESGSKEITTQFLNILSSRKYNITSDFRDEIAYYIDSIYETADFKDSSFVEDLIRRIELQMEETDGAAAYKKDLAIDSTFVPYSKIVQSRKQAKITEQTEKTDNDIYNKNEAETHKQTHRFDNRPAHTNILLLALSTFQNVIRKSTFSYDFYGCKGEVTGRYQLDPIPKMLDELLAQNGENLDKIIMLCTDDTTQKIASIQTPEGELKDISPAEYFQNQVRNYMNPFLKNNELFTPINISIDSPYEGIQKVVKTIRNIKNPHLYLDTHGGLRGIQRILEATITLLKIEGVPVREAYSVAFTDKNTVKPIISETEQMKIFDFVSGINEFITCGRADTLTEYYKEKSKYHFQNDIVSKITTVANGIQWCCVPEFERGLTSLQEYFQQHADKNADPYLSIYIDDIKRDYQNLVLSKYSVVDEINWCIKKKFYQQALTLIESRISKLLFEEWKILELNTSQWTENRTSYNETTTSYTIKHDAKNPGKYTVEYTTKSQKSGEKEDVVDTDINDFFNGFVYNFQTEEYNKNGKIIRDSNFKPFLGCKDFNNMTNEKYDSFTDYLSQINFHSIDTQIPACINLARKKLQISGKTHKIRINLPDAVIIPKKTNEKLLFQLLVLHKTLKDVRNTMNHASDRLKYQPEAIILSLKYYMKWVDALNPNKQSS